MVGLVADGLARDVGIEHQAAFMRGADGRGQCGPGGLLQHVARHAEFQEPAHVLAVVVLTEHQDLRLGVLLPNLHGGFEPAEPRHRNIEQDDVGPQPARGVDRLASVGGFSDDGDVVGKGEECADAFADDRMVVGDEDADLRHSSPRA